MLPYVMWISIHLKFVYVCIVYFTAAESRGLEGKSVCVKWSNVSELYESEQHALKKRETMTTNMQRNDSFE